MTFLTEAPRRPDNAASGAADMWLVKLIETLLQKLFPENVGTADKAKPGEEVKTKQEEAQV